MPSNSLLMERAFAVGTNNFQQRTAAANVNAYEAAMAALSNPYNTQVWNAVTGLMFAEMNTIVEGKRFEDPLAVLKKPAYTTPAGNFERHVAVGYMKQHGYRVDTETLLKYEPASYVEWVQPITRQAQYEFSFARFEVARSLRDPNGWGLNDLLMQTINQQATSDNVDEMNECLAQLSIADKNGGLYRHHIEQGIDTREGATELLAQIRAYTDRMKLPTMLYNHIDVPVFENPDSLVLLVSAEAGVMAYLDVLALANLFNLEKADVRMRVISVPSLGIDGAYAALMSEDFIYIRDVLYGIFSDGLRADTLADKYYLHHWSMIGANPAANCILFGNFEGGSTIIPTVTQTVSGLSFAPDSYEVEAGGMVRLSLELDGTVTGSDGATAVAPDAALFTVVGERDGEPIALNQRTQVDRNGVLHVQKMGIAAGDVLTVTAVSAYVDPSAQTTESYSATATVTVVDAGTPASVDADPYIDYTDQTTDTPA